MPLRCGTTSASARHSTISALPNSVRVQAPTGKRMRIEIQRIERVDTPGGAWAGRLRSRRKRARHRRRCPAPPVAAAPVAVSDSGASTSHSSGPSHSAVRSRTITARHGAVPSNTPIAMPMVAAAAVSARTLSRMPGSATSRPGPHSAAPIQPCSRVPSLSWNIGGTTVTGDDPVRHRHDTTCCRAARVHRRPAPARSNVAASRSNRPT